jgi:diguanylate cyclase (GGDEF)-like protein
MDKLVVREEFIEKIQQLIDTDEIPFSVAIADIDNFKSINSTYGREIGDQVIRKTISILRQNISERDLITKYGDEFSVLLLDKGAESSFMYIEEIRKYLSENTFKFSIEGQTYDIGISISCGIASYPRDAKTSVELLRMMDSSLFKAKKLGKNRVCLSETETLVLKSCHLTKTQIERLGQLSNESEKTEAFLIREAIDDLLKKHSK